MAQLQALLHLGMGNDFLADRIEGGHIPNVAASWPLLLKQGQRNQLSAWPRKINASIDQLGGETAGAGSKSKS